MTSSADDESFGIFASKGGRRIRLAVNAILTLPVIWLIVIVIVACATQSLKFDGSMNLLLSRSIADGNGPRDVYDSADLFPASVQTNGLFILIGAVVIKIFGVGPFQNQLPNLIFLFSLCISVIFAIKKSIDLTTALVACISLLSTPALLMWGLSGYGEIPTLFFGFSALALVSLPHRNGVLQARHCLAAGLFAGLALTTKVVGIVMLAVVGIVITCRLLTENGLQWKRLILRILQYSAGVATPIIGFELWRLAEMGPAGYRAWWLYQYWSILSHAGAKAAGQNHSIASKIVGHFLILSRDFGLNPSLMICALIIPLAGLIFCYLNPIGRGQKQRSRWLLLGLTTLVALYFPWWLAFVPDEKAWFRYIYIGVIGIEIISAIAMTRNIYGAIFGKNIVRRIIHGSFAVTIMMIYAPTVARAIKQKTSSHMSEEIIQVKSAASLISALPAKAKVFGYGWYAAPTIQMYSSRPFMDLTDWPIGRLTGESVYVIADQATLITGILEPLLNRYPHHALMASNRFAQIYVVNFDHPTNPFTNVDHSQVLPSVTFAPLDYPYTIGMEPFDPIGGRFVGSDSEILLKYEGQPLFEITAYMDEAVPSYYRWPSPLKGTVFIEGCDPVNFGFKHAGWQQFHLKLNCHAKLGSDLRVRILLDNIMDLRYMFDRQRVFLVKAIGFEVPTPQGSIN